MPKILMKLVDIHTLVYTIERNMLVFWSVLSSFGVMELTWTCNITFLIVGYRSIISVPSSPRVASTVATDILIVVDVTIIIIAAFPSVVCAWTSRTMPPPEKAFFCKISIYKHRRKLALNLFFPRRAWRTQKEISEGQNCLKHALSIVAYIWSSSEGSSRTIPQIRICNLITSSGRL